MSVHVIACMALLAGAACSETPAPTPPAVASLSISSRNAVLELGVPETLTVVALDVSGRTMRVTDVAFELAPASAGAISATGVLVPAIAGSFAVRARAAGVVTSRSYSSLAASAVRIQLTAGSSTVAVGNRVQVMASLVDARNRNVEAPVAWETTNSTIATIAPNGELTGVSDGWVYVRARSGPLSDSILVTVGSPPSEASQLVVTPPFASLGVGDSVRLGAVMVTSDGVRTTPVSLSYESLSPLVATVQNGLVRALAAGVANVRVTAGASGGGSGGLSTVVRIVVASPLPALTISRDSVLAGGTFELSALNVRGVVTLSGPTTFNVQGDVFIDGGLVGNCVGLTINATGTVVVRHPILTQVGLQVACTTRTNDPASSITIIARGGYEFTRMGFRSAGNISITNDPTLASADFAAAPSDRATVGCIFDAANTQAVAAPRGVDGQVGTPGGDGHDIDIACRGSMRLANSTFITGQSGGDGGVATHTSASAAYAVGGAGGRAGTARVRATGDIEVVGQVDVRAAVPGNGGSATATAEARTTGLRVGAWAVGGTGGASGGGSGPAVATEVRAAGRVIRTGNAVLELGIFPSGIGGAATAMGARGTDAAATPAQNGGDATAIGGNGGPKGASIVIAGEGPQPASPFLLLIGGSGGRGGAANATAGDGGNGNAAYPDGAPGGRSTAQGGTGATTLQVNVAGQTPAAGGVGGAVTIAGGSGGEGFDGCASQTTGGRGGPGGAISGSNGASGAGQIAGATPGMFTIDGAGIGGAGGRGRPSGAGGAGGANNTAPRTPALVINNALSNGANGASCSP